MFFHGIRHRSRLFFGVDAQLTQGRCGIWMEEYQLNMIGDSRDSPAEGQLKGIETAGKSKRGGVGRSGARALGYPCHVVESSWSTGTSCNSDGFFLADKLCLYLYHIAGSIIRHKQIQKKYTLRPRSQKTAETNTTSLLDNEWHRHRQRTHQQTSFRQNTAGPFYQTPPTQRMKNLQICR